MDYSTSGSDISDPAPTSGWSAPTRDTMIIWDLNKIELWREYQVLPVPITGLEWCPIFMTEEELQDQSTEGRNLSYLALIVYGSELYFSPEEEFLAPATVKQAKKQQQSPPQEYTNYVAYLNLLTGQVIQLRDSAAKFGLFSPVKSHLHTTSTGTLSNPALMEEVASYLAKSNSQHHPRSKEKMQQALHEEQDCPCPGLVNTTFTQLGKMRHRNCVLESQLLDARVSNLGLYLCILFHGQHAELWDTKRLRFLNYIMLPEASPPAAMVSPYLPFP
ncbi:hypothetical protein Ciccas_012988 [Cichlidogyrus casuarinus]|uniref:Uncharacterized protein n=1 Tax=Cichlidogyrus casuarinus TaxID=1844966 RepID=A0ABD2PLS8_9PLAT